MTLPSGARRRSLTHVGGPASLVGDAAMAARLAEALDVRPAPPLGKAPDASLPEDPDRVHVHGFHAYPARMHPETAARLVNAVSRPGDAVLDPFCGSGTVLVETRIAGRRAIGVDLNPLAVRLARLKTNPLDAPARAALTTTARGIADFATARRKRKAGATHRYPREDVELFDPHVLLELDSIQAGIAVEAENAPALRDALELVLSSMLLKVSRRASDTSMARATRRIAAGFTTRLFAAKADELSRRLAELAAKLPPQAPPARVELDDAARLSTVAASTVDAVVTSPPYASTYDYAAQHAPRLRWLGLDATRFMTSEMGARRRYAPLDGPAARSAWIREMGAALRALRRVCRPKAVAVLLVADSAVGDEALRAEAIVQAAASGQGFALVARASQTRPHFHSPTARAFRDRPRSEHAIALQKE